tara:strand:+ start:1014 stop:1319 length:306 start_codon:yes stop_codon:yes gene_type:complete
MRSQIKSTTAKRRKEKKEYMRQPGWQLEVLGNLFCYLMFSLTMAKPPGVVAMQTVGIHAQASTSSDISSKSVSRVSFLSSEDSRKISINTKPADGSLDGYE